MGNYRWFRCNAFQFGTIHLLEVSTLQPQLLLLLIHEFAITELVHDPIQAVQPFAGQFFLYAGDHVLHHGNVRRRTAKADQSELEKDKANLG